MNINNTNHYDFNNLQTNINTNQFNTTDNLLNTSNILSDTLKSLSSPLNSNNSYLSNTKFDNNQNINLPSEIKDENKSKYNIGSQSHLFSNNRINDTNNKKSLMNKNSLEILQCLLKKE